MYEQRLDYEGSSSSNKTHNEGSNSYAHFLPFTVLAIFSSFSGEISSLFSIAEKIIFICISFKLCIHVFLCGVTCT